MKVIEKLKSMSAEKLAETMDYWVFDCYNCMIEDYCINRNYDCVVSCKARIFDWLNSEVNDV